MQALPAYKVLGVITVTAGSPVPLLTAFPTILPPRNAPGVSPLVNTIFFQAHEGNGSDYIYVGDGDMVSGDDNTRGACLAAREWINYSSGANGNCLDPRDFKVDCSAGTKKVRVQILKV